MRLAGLLAAAMLAACSNPLGPQYEYEEQLYLNVGGTATVIVDASLASLVALRGAAIDPSPDARLDRAEIQRVFERAGCTVDNVSQTWRRKGRRFIQIRVSTADVYALAACGLLSWSSYSLIASDEGLHYRQTVGAAAGQDPGPVSWDGSELVGFKLHLPSRITYHNVKRLKDGQDGTIERGNILTWEQRLADRRAGQPIDMDVRMDRTSILFTTLWLFAGAFAAAVAALGLIIWLTIRRGRRVAKSKV